MSSTVPKTGDAAGDATGDAAQAAGARLAIVTLGCGRNEVDSDQLAGLLDRNGYQLVDDANQAEVVLVNTCTFIEPAKQESIDTILAACDLKQETARSVVVTGCMAQKYPDELAEAIPEADAIVGFAAYPQLPDLLEDLLAGREVDRIVVGEAGVDPGTGADSDGNPGPTPPRTSLPLLVGDSQPAAQPQDPARDRPTTPQDELDRMPASGPRFPVRRYGAGDGPDRPWAYLKIASGCDRSCTFCTIPSFRGAFRSRPPEEILDEAAWLADRGARELVMVSENTTSWGKDLPGGRDLQPRLLERLAGVDGLERIRLMYLQPDELQAPLVEAIAGIDEVCSYFDLSLQHVATPILRSMARGGDAEAFRELIARIRELDPGAVFRSNFILGFPGETEEHVTQLEAFLADVKLDWVGLFPFSPEETTPSVDYPDQVDPEEARARVRHISQVQERLADDAARAFVGRQLEVTVEQAAGDADDGLGEPCCSGRSYREAPETDGEIRLVTSSGEPADLPVGRTVTAEVTGAVGVDLVAEVTAARA